MISHRLDVNEGVAVRRFAPGADCSLALAQWVSYRLLQTVSMEHNKETIWRSLRLTSPELGVFLGGSDPL